MDRGSRDLQIDRRAGAAAALRVGHHLAPTDRHGLIERKHPPDELGWQVLGQPAGESLSLSASIQPRHALRQSFQPAGYGNIHG